jgi:hypothetical protein
VIHFASTAAQLDTCRRCGMPVLCALDEGMLTRVDLLPIPLAAQVAALAAGIHTYAQISGGYLAYRDPSRLADPRMSERVHIPHHCTRRKT